MNELLQKKQKYGSLIASSCIHAFLLLGLYAVRTIKNNLFEQHDLVTPTHRQTPASVSMSSSASPLTQTPTNQAIQAPQSKTPVLESQ